MGSGQKRVVFNTRERAVSTDVNRVQAFLAGQRAEQMARLCTDRYVQDVSNGLAIEPDPLATSVDADVYGGLMVVPQIGSSSITITRGVVGFYLPDDPPDLDSETGYKIIHSPGVQVPGQLVIAANPGSGTRIDVIECTPMEQVEESSSRDVFNPTTGLFSPVLTKKVVAGRLQFRVRQGTPGGGFPGTVPGWLPLAVASIPGGKGATTNDVTFWDVRPLVQDRAEQPTRAGRIAQTHTSHYLTADSTSLPGGMFVFGTCEGAMGAQKTGGTLFKGTPSAVMGTGDVPAINIFNVENHEPGLTLVPNAIWYVWSLFPFGLPRWVRYTETDLIGKGRVPCSMRGICVASITPPGGFGGAPKVPILLPNSTGLGGSTQYAWMVAAGLCNSAGVPQEFLTDGHNFIFDNAAILIGTPTVHTPTVDTYELPDNLAYPANARSIRVVFTSIFKDVAAETTGTYMRSVSVFNDKGDKELAVIHAEQVIWTFPAAVASTEFFVCDIPLRIALPGAGGSVTRKFQVKYTPISMSMSKREFANASIIGWRIGP